MDPPVNSNSGNLTNDEEVEEVTEKIEPQPLEQQPGPVDPEILAEKLQALAGDDASPKASLLSIEGKTPSIASPTESHEVPLPPRPTEESAFVHEDEDFVEPIEISIGPFTKCLEESDDDGDDMSDMDQQLVIYGNVSIQLPKFPILQKEKKVGESFQTEILKTFCMETVSDISPNRTIRMEVESVFWERSFTCPKCPGDFNCTCKKDIGDVLSKMTNCFDIVVIPDNRCTICLQVLDLLRQKKTIFCQVNVDTQDTWIVEELKRYLSLECNRCLVSQVFHHWSHEDQDPESAEVELLGEKINLPPPDYLEVIVIGTNSAALSICEEAESCGISVGLIDVESNDSSSLCGFYKTYSGYGHALKKFFLEASLVKEAIKLAPFCSIEGTDQVTFDWSHFRSNAKKYMNSNAWERRMRFSKSGIFYVVGTPNFIDRNTVQVTCRQGNITLRAKYLVYSPDTRLVYDHFSGLHRYCYKMHKILSYNSLELSRTLIYGSTINTLEFAGIFSSLGFEVTLMMSSKIHPKYDVDMMKKLTDYMKDCGVVFLENSRIQAVTPVPRSASGTASIPNVLEKFMVIGQYVDSGKYYRGYFDNVIVVPNEEAFYDESYGLEDIGVKFCKYNQKLIQVDEQFRTSATNVYAIGTAVHGIQYATKMFDDIGRQLVKGISKNQNIDIKFDAQFYAIYTPVEYAFYGLSEVIARATYENVIVYHALYDPIELSLVPLDRRMPCYIKLICKIEGTSHKIKREIIVGMHVVGYNAVKIVSGYSTAISEGLTKETLDKTLGIDLTCASTMTSLDKVKNIGDSVLVHGGCC